MFSTYDIQEVSAEVLRAEGSIHCMEEEEEETKHEEMLFNLTTPNISPLQPNPGYIITPFVLLIVIGCGVAVVVYMMTKSRLDELRHRLIPLYSYDPAEAEEWRDEGSGDDKELTEPLYKEGKLSFSSDYGT